MKTPMFNFAVLPPKKRKVLMRFIDAGPGSPNWAKFQCRKCQHEMETHTATNADLRKGFPCPVCNEVGDAVI